MANQPSKFKFFPRTSNLEPRTFLCLVFWLLTAFAAPTRAAVFHPETFTLANGLQIVVIKNRLSPAASLMVWYKAGSADEATGHSGLAHYLEHLMFRGTKETPAGEFSRLIAAQGGDDNAFTSHDATVYHEEIAADQLALAMRLEADRMQNLDLSPAIAAPELSVVLSERQERTENNPQGLFHEKLRKAFYPDHPYGIPVIGWKDEIAKTTPDDARDFYLRHYAPNNAIVIVSGNVDTNDVRKLAEDTFGRVPARETATPRVWPKLAEPKQKRVTMADPRVGQPHIEIHILAPSYKTQAKNEAYALETLAEALAGGEVGALYRRLVIQNKIAAAVDMSYDPQSRGPSDFTIVATPQPGRTIAELETALTKTLGDLARDGLDAKTVNEAKGRLTRSAVFARDTLTAAGLVIGGALTTGQTTDDVEAWPDQIEAVTPDEVNAAFRKLIKQPHRVTGILKPSTNK